ncbi:MAG TPA: hypothetical protein VMS73_07145 [Anaerolineaceae bacterium]|nr:hypothetical protein [Anaerolineaceae bacterium]
METTISSTQTKIRKPMVAVMASCNFRMLWLGQSTSLLGDQFYLIAMPWLVLQRPGAPLPAMMRSLTKIVGQQESPDRQETKR